MREYYRRLFREARQRVSMFGKVQVIVSALAGIIAAGYDGTHGVMAPTLIFQSAIGVVIGYLAVLGFYSVSAMVRAPVVLDGQRAAMIDGLRSEITALKRKPWSAARERAVREEAQKLPDDAIRIMQHLMLYGETTEDKLRFSGWHEERLANALNACMKTANLVRRRHVSRAAPLVGVNHYSVDEKLLPILEQIWGNGPASPQR